MNGYLIPANSKKGTLILNLFREVDLIIFGTGIFVSLLTLMFVPTTNVVAIIICLLPALITGFLVVPIPNYHNVLCAIESILHFYMTRRQYHWKGWCFYERIIQEQRNQK
jgi:hypothetical protein